MQTCFHSISMFYSKQKWKLFYSQYWWLLNFLKICFLYKMFEHFLKTKIKLKVREILLLH